MKNFCALTALIALVAGMSAPMTYAMDKAESKQPPDAIEDQAQDVADRAERGRDKLDRQAKKKDRVSDKMDKEPSDVPAYEDGARHDGAQDSIAREERSKDLDNAATPGNEKSQEMRARRDESKAIKDEYKAGKKSGDGKLGSDAESLEEDAREEEEKQGKKPWWKFWEQ